MPSIREEMFFETNEEYHRGVAIDEYNGKFTLVPARESDSGIWAEWGYPQKRVDGQNEPGPTAIPMGLGRMEKDQLVALCKWVLEGLGEITNEDLNLGDDLAF